MDTGQAAAIEEGQGEGSDTMLQGAWLCTWRPFCLLSSMSGWSSYLNGPPGSPASCPFLLSFPCTILRLSLWPLRKGAMAVTIMKW